MHFDSNDDTLRRYLDDIRQTAPLNRISEQTYFQLIQEAREIKANPNATKKELDDAEAKHKHGCEALISANMRFVLKVAIQYRHCPIPLPDLVSEGAMGLVRAIESFDASRGLKFISYAVWWIKAYITRAINENGSLIRLPANQHLRVRKALKEQARGKEIDEDIRELIQLGERGISFDSPLKSDTKTTYSEVLADTKASNPEADAESNNFGILTRDLLAELPEREAKVIAGIYGINQESPQTLREVGESMGISHERVRQLRDQALRRIRKLHTVESINEQTGGLLGGSGRTAESAAASAN
ncbi:MAG: sigma-70 family RNA polymerase sigma factor [Fibrobacterales bacterium]|nr:sigma-70 family RNA polymerase sigma factor [Fibrobacterales bacterium]